MASATVASPARRPTAVRVRARLHRMRRLFPPLVALLLFIGLWQVGVFHALLHVQAYTLAYPSAILEALAEDADALFAQAVVTLTEALVGYALGSAIGLGLAITFVRFDTARRVLAPIANGINSVPIVAIAPLMVLYFGSGQPSKIAIVTIMTLAPMAVIAFKGLVQLEPSTLELMHAFASSDATILRKLRLPSSLPFVFQALKLNVTLALIGAIVGEFFSSQGGLGFFMNHALVTYQIPVAWAIMIIAGAAGVAMFLVVSMIERLVIPWHASFRPEPSSSPEG
jgi:NitT/TauT family transport system permease protein